MPSSPEVDREFRAAAESLPRIAYLVESYHPVVGGMESQARSLVESLTASGFEVLVITRRSRRDLAKRERRGRSAIRRIPPVGDGLLRRWEMVFTSLLALIGLRAEYDVIFVSGYRALGISAVLARKILGKPCALKADNNGEMSGAFFAGGLRRLRMTPSSLPVKLLLGARNRLLRTADVFVSLFSEMTLELTTHGVGRGKITEITNSVDIGRFRPVARARKAELRQELGLPVGDKIAVYTGRLVSWKGLPLLLRVWQRIAARHRHANLILVGSGGSDIFNCEAELRDFVARHGLQDRVRFTGSVDNIQEYLQASDIYVLPSENDAFPVALLEAMACGLAVITTPVGGIADIVAHRENGLMVEPRNFDELLDAIDRLLDDESLAAFLGAAALETARTKYSGERITRQYIEVFRQLARNRPRN